MKALKIHLVLLGLKSYVVSPLTSAPSAINEPVAYHNWVMNNGLVCAVILTALDESEYEGLDDTKTTANLYAQVKTRAEGKGPVWMISLIQEVLRIQCLLSEPLTMTGKWISDIVERIFTIQTLDKDLFKCVVLLNSLNSPQYSSIQAQISHGLADSTRDAPYKLDNIQKLLKMVQNLSNLKSSATDLAMDTALATTM